MTDIAVLDGVFYQQYAKKIQNLMTDYSEVQDKVRFVTKEQQNGGFYNQPVTVRPEAAATYYTGSSDAMYTIATPVGSNTQNAQVMGSQLTIPSNISYAQMAKADSSTKAFVNATAYTVTNNLNIHKKRIEIACLYGADLGTTSGVVVENTSTTATVTISAATWAGGIWSGLEGIALNFYDGSSLVSSGADAIFTLGVVSDGSTKTFSVTGTSGGIDALVIASSSPLTVVFDGSYSNTMLGINQILTTADKFGINGGTYSLWNGNVVSQSGTLSFGKINASLGVAVNRGGLKEDVVVWMNPNTFNDLSAELAGLRRYEDGQQSATQGHSRLMYYAQSGNVTIMPYALVKNGDAFILPMKRLIRLGATDVTFERAGATNGYTGKYFLDEPTKNGVQLRSYSHQAIFIDSPAKCVKITGFTNSVN